MKNTYAIIGGDLRLVYLANLLAKDENEVYSFGIEQQKQEFKQEYNKEKVNSCNNLEEAISNSNIVISSVPLSKNGINVYAPYNLDSSFINLNYLAKSLSNKIFFAGQIPDMFYELSENKNTKIYDLMKQEDLTILNTIATAEGAISDIILNTKCNLHKSKILILGFGRVAKTLAVKLKGLDAYITCAARKDKDFAWINTLGFESININNISIIKEDSIEKEKLKKFDIIINTEPQIILDENNLKYVKENCFLLDLASKPGGIDGKACEKYNLNYKLSLAIPGKVSPLTSAEFIKETIYNILKYTT